MMISRLDKYSKKKLEKNKMYVGSFVNLTDTEFIRFE